MKGPQQLRLQGVLASPSMVRNIWIREGLETRYKRILRLGEALHGKGIELTEDHVRLIERATSASGNGRLKAHIPAIL